MDALRSSSALLGATTATTTSCSTSSAHGAGRHLVSLSSTRSVVFGGIWQVRRMQNPAPWTTTTKRNYSCIAATASAAPVAGSAGTLYSVLGVGHGGSLSEIKSAYKEMARRYHPDVCPPSERDVCTQKFLQVRHAYEILSDPEKRAEYDYGLMHPSFAQALKNSSPTTSPWGRSRRTQGSEGVSDAWRIQWEAQLSRLRQREAVNSATKSNSWGARMRQETSQH